MGIDYPGNLIPSQKYAQECSYKLCLNRTGMKKVIFLFIGFLFLICSSHGTGSNGNNKTTTNGNDRVAEQSLTIFATPDLYNYAKMWAGEYGILHPQVKTEVIRVTDFQKTDIQNRGANISIVSDKNLASLDDEIWKMAIGREVIVPVISSKNSFLDKINRKGISSDELAEIVKKSGKQTWGTLLGNRQAAPVHTYMINDESVLSQVAMFLKTEPGLIDGIKVANKEELISALQKDVNGIGFCRITDLVDPKNQSIVESIKLLPIDKNSNGKLDYFEKIYTDLPAFVRGVWIGKYPKSLCRTIYSISTVKPSDETEVGFLTWVITGGQNVLNPVDSKDLAFGSRESEKAVMLSSSQMQVGMVNDSGFFTDRLNTPSLVSLILIVLIPFVLAFMIGDAVIRQKRHNKAGALNVTSLSTAVFDENSVEAPKGLYFDTSHMWAFMEKNGLVRIGIDDFLQHITGSLTGIKMKEPGEQVAKGDKLLSIIQNGKQLTIVAPISGTIKDQNTSLLRNTSVMNSSPYSDGWVYLIEPTKWSNEIRYLTMAEKYQEWIKLEFARLKDFIAGSVMTNGLDLSTPILQDGGEIKDGVLADLGPTEWEDFQIHFIDKSR